MPSFLDTTFAAAATALLVLGGCGPSGSETETRLVLIGLDGANWEVLQPMIREGRLPNLAALTREGSTGILWSEEPTITPAVWTTILTGRTREEHGIQGFTAQDPQTGKIIGVRSTMRRVPAIWTALNEEGVRTGVAGAHVTWPAEPVDGFMITRRCTERLKRTTYPSALAVRAVPGDPGRLREILERPEDEEPPPERAFEHLARLFVYDAAAFDLGIETLRADRPTFLFLYLHLPDVAQHVLWPAGEKLRESAPWPPDMRYVERVYEYVDERLGELLAIVRTPETSVMVVSDHGATAGGYVELMERHTERLVEAMGFLELDGKRPDLSRSRVLPAVEAARRIEFAVNREALGAAASEADVRRVAEEFREALAEVRLERSGRAVFHPIDLTPDGTRVVTLMNLTADASDDNLLLRDGRLPLARVYRPIQFTSSHSRRGVLIASGPAFRRGVSLFPPDWIPGTDGDGTETATIYDVFPTVFAALRLPVPAGGPGRVLEELLDPARPALEPDGSVASPPRPVEDVPEPESDPELEALRRLGYTR